MFYYFGDIGGQVTGYWNLMLCICLYIIALDTLWQERWPNTSL